MNYFTSLGITVAIFGATFLFAVLAFPIEVIGLYLTPFVQIVLSCIVAVVYFGSFQWLNLRKL